MSGTDKASVSRFPIWHHNMTVCYGDADKARYLRQQFPTSYLALSQRSFHAFQSSQFSLFCSSQHPLNFHLSFAQPSNHVPTFPLLMPSKSLVSSMPDGPDHPETWVFHLAMAWLGNPDHSLDYKERLAMIKERAQELGEPTRSAFTWIPADTPVHKADISYWISQPWDNHGGRLTLVGDAAHPMPPCESNLFPLSENPPLTSLPHQQTVAKASTTASATYRIFFRPCPPSPATNRHSLPP